MSDCNVKFIQGNQINNFSGGGGSGEIIPILYVLNKQQENSFNLLSKFFFKYTSTYY